MQQAMHSYIACNSLVFAACVCRIPCRIQRLWVEVQDHRSHVSTNHSLLPLPARCHRLWSKCTGVCWLPLVGQHTLQPSESCERSCWGPPHSQTQQAASQPSRHVSHLTARFLRMRDWAMVTRHTWRSVTAAGSRLSHHTAPPQGCLVCRWAGYQAGA